MPLFTSGGLGLGLVTLVLDLVLRIWSCVHDWLLPFSSYKRLKSDPKFAQSAGTPPISPPPTPPPHRCQASGPGCKAGSVAFFRQSSSKKDRQLRVILLESFEETIYEEKRSLFR